MELLPNSLSFRVITTLDVTDESQIPTGYTGRVRLSALDRLMYVAWYTDGQLHNPARTEPAFRRFRDNGQVRYEMFYDNGQLADPTPSRPAVRGYFANGALHYEERYDDGKRCDGPKGEAALRKFRQDGTLRHELRYRNGNRVVDKRETANAS